MKDSDCVEFLQWALPQLGMRWPGFRKVRRQVCRRVDRRLRELGLETTRAYRDYLSEHPAEWNALDTLCRIPISRFYRDRGVFDCLRERVLPELAKDAVARGESALGIWSAGCASGEEPFTLDIIWQLDLTAKFPQLDCRIIATDIDEHMLERANRGCYSSSSLKDLPEVWREAAFTRQEEEYCIKSEFRTGIEFCRQDIRHQMPDGPFHLILCRHLVFTYFDDATQQQLLQQLLGKLVPGGFLVTGKQETSELAPDRLKQCQPPMGIYRLLTPSLA